METVITRRDLGDFKAASRILREQRTRDLELADGKMLQPLPLEVTIAHHVLTTIRAQHQGLFLALPKVPPRTIATISEEDPVTQLALTSADRVSGARGRDLTTEVDQFLAKKGIVAGATLPSHDAVLNILRVGPGKDELTTSVAPIFDINALAVTSALRAALKTATGDAAVVSDVLDELSSFAKEALDNARIHARASVVAGKPLTGTEFVLVRRLPVETLSRVQGTEALETFRRGLESVLERRGQERGDQVALLELTIGDSGEGIAATMTDDLDVYTHPHLLELNHVSKAFRDGETRPKQYPNLAPSTQKGQGFTNMLRATHALRGLVRIWTGRSLLEQSLIDSAGGREDFDSDRVTSTLAWKWRELPLVRGTTVSALVAIDLRVPNLMDSLFDLA